MHGGIVRNLIATVYGKSVKIVCNDRVPVATYRLKIILRGSVQMYQSVLIIVVVMFLPFSAFAADGKISSLQGNAWINGKPVHAGSTVHFGDHVLTGARASITIILDENVYRLGKRASLTLPTVEKRGKLSLLYGALVAVFRHHSHKTIYTGTAVLGVRGTGFYLNSKFDETYLCLCYGDVDLADAENLNKQAHIHAEHHNAVVFDHQTLEIRGNQPMLDHQDVGLFELEALAGRVPPETFRAEMKKGNRLTFSEHP